MDYSKNIYSHKCKTYFYKTVQIEFNYNKNLDK